ncbi:MAG: MFS transporter [Litorivicinaceae bacterium]|nr:MAG: MFS transporter [Litorivicinaceae bacterium]
MTADIKLFDRPFLGYLVSRSSIGMTNTMLVMALGWHLYQLTGDAWSIAFVGLAQIVPVYAFFFVSGIVVDYVPRIWVVQGCALIEAIAIFGIAMLMIDPTPTLWAVYALVCLHGTGRAFHAPALQAIVPNIVHEGVLDRAVAMSTTVWNTAMILGPALGGFLIVWFDRSVYFVIAGIILFALLGYALIPTFRVTHTTSRTLRSFFDGMRFVKNQSIILGGLTVDMLMVGFGSVLVLLPIYAIDVLNVGAESLGVLRSMPALGSILVGVILASRPPMQGAGKKLFIALCLFVGSILGFAVSNVYWLSLIALFFYGASDMVSMNIRSAMVHRATPEHLRGRVSAVNMLFIQTSNEAGDFRGGSFAAMFGPVTTGVLGAGIAALVLIWSRWQFAPLYQLNRTADLKPTID